MVNVQIITDCSVFDRFCFWCIVCLLNESINLHQWIKPWKSYVTVDIMQKQNMNWFATVLRVVICFIILTELTEFSVEVLCGWSVRWSRRSRCEKKEERQDSSLGMPEAPQVNISKDTQASKLGDAPVGIPSFFFNNYRYTSVFVLFTWFVSFVCFFLFKNHASMR